MSWYARPKIPVIGEWRENWVGILPKDLDVAANLGKKIIIPDGIKPFIPYSSSKKNKNDDEPLFPCTGYLYSMINKEGGTRESEDGDWTFSSCDLIVESEERKLQKRTVTSYSKVLIYEGELEYPEMYKRYPPEQAPYSDRGLHLTGAELSALHWHARAFLDWEEEKVFSRFAQYPNAIDNDEE